MLPMTVSKAHLRDKTSSSRWLSVVVLPLAGLPSGKQKPGVVREVPAPRANARQEQNSPVSGHVSQGRVGGRQGKQWGHLPCSALCSELAINVTRHLRPHSPRKSTQELLLSSSVDFMEGLGVLFCCRHPEIVPYVAHAIPRPSQKLQQQDGCS